MPSIDFSQYKHFDCYNCAIELVSHRMHRNCDLRYISAFGFHYHQQDAVELLNNSSVWFNTRHYYTLLSRYCGLFVESTAANTIEHPGERLAQLLREHPVIGLSIDSFYLPWNPLFQKFHRGHLILIYGAEDQDYLCMDPYLVNKSTRLSKDILHEQYTALYTYNICEQKIFDIHSLIQVQKQYVCTVAEESLGNMLQLAEDIERYQPENDGELPRFRHNSLSTSKLMFGLTNVAWSRQLYRRSLEKADGLFSTDVFRETVLLLNECVDPWLMLCPMLLHMVTNTKSRNGPEKISAHIRKIVSIEAQIYAALQAL